ncbi:hypothetical protein Droror1_Dr00017901 [Drosera rotundifolia]
MAASPSTQQIDPDNLNRDTEDEDDDEQLEEGLDAWDDWDDEDDEESMEASGFQCLFCESMFDSSDSVFEHCKSDHRFDFGGIRQRFGLDFYGSMKLINYVRSRVHENRCWICAYSCKSRRGLLHHLHEPDLPIDLLYMWAADKYLQPFMEGDSLLYSFDMDEGGEEEEPMDLGHDEELATNLGDSHNIDYKAAALTRLRCHSTENGLEECTSISNGHVDAVQLLNQRMIIGVETRGMPGSFHTKHEDNSMRTLLNAAASEIIKVNESYFGSYSSYGIHREMLSDKPRMEAYSQAILNNPSLLRGSIVMDVGCGTGILSLFAAKAGASRVFAIEASKKMTAVATQIAKDNGFLFDENSNHYGQATGVISVVHGMVEELDKSLQVQDHSVDVLLSEWMGYCLLYESMLSSVLLARDKWLKPGGAILPDTATMFVAGFDRGGTSLPFWENVYGFNMSSVGKELVADASQAPIIDVVDSSDIVTTSAVLQNFDLVTMKPNDMDFTSLVELEPRPAPEPAWCYGVVLWFETGFTSRFCKEMPMVLSTSPYTPKTHWSQTILTFKEPLAISFKAPGNYGSSAAGGWSSPALKILLRISIAHAEQHRAIDISLETTAVGHDGRKHSLPAQIFNLN